MKPPGWLRRPRLPKRPTWLRDLEWILGTLLIAASTAIYEAVDLFERLTKTGYHKEPPR